MREFALRVLKNVVPVAVLLAVCGYGFAVAAGMYVANGRDSGDELKTTLAWRLPFTLAAWGGGMVFLYELFRTLWGQKPTTDKPTSLTTASPVLDAEQLLQQLLDQADAAEEVRRSGALPLAGSRSSVADQTPMPCGEPLPVRTFEPPAPPPFR